MNKTPQTNHRQGGEWEINEPGLRDKSRQPEREREYEPELDVDLEIVEIGEADPSIEQEERRKRIGKIIGDIGNVDDFVDNQISWPTWGPKKGEA